MRSVDSNRLRAVKLVHTIAWAFFAGCIVAIPLASLAGEHRAVVWLTGIRACPMGARIRLTPAALSSASMLNGA